MMHCFLESVQRRRKCSSPHRSQSRTRPGSSGRMTQVWRNVSRLRTKSTKTPSKKNTCQMCSLKYCPLNSHSSILQDME